MKYNKKHIPVEPETHQRFKIASVKAGMNYDELIKYALNLIAAYPPTQDYKWAQEQKATDD